MKSYQRILFQLINHYDTRKFGNYKKSFSRIAYLACGIWGVRITDMCLIITLLEVRVTYIITFSALIFFGFYQLYSKCIFDMKNDSNITTKCN